MSVRYRVAVAVSGGLDSTALLHCTARLTGADVEVHALHVHHGLQPEADAWMAQVAAQCRRWRTGGMPIRFHGFRVTGHPAPGDSIEAWARRMRYQALAQMARAADCKLVLLAHHRQDQAETVLLQALRGAGPAGLAAMPRSAQRQGLTWARPWLDLPREAIVGYARRWRLAFVADPSNADQRYARSRLRQQLWPGLLQAFPDAEVTLAMVARRAHEAREIADEVALRDLADVAAGHGLRVPAWAALSPARQTNVLRHWLAAQLGAPVPESLVQRLAGELPGRAVGSWPAGDRPLRLHGGVLAVGPLRAGGWAGPREFPLVPSDVQPKTVDLSQPGVHALTPWAGSVRVEEVAQGGVPAALLRLAQWRPRVGGEQFQSNPAGVPRSLKKQFQDRSVPAWLRDGPLLWAGGHLVFVPGLGLDARMLGLTGSPRVLLGLQP